MWSLDDGLPVIPVYRIGEGTFLFGKIVVWFYEPTLHSLSPLCVCTDMDPKGVTIR